MAVIGPDVRIHPSAYVHESAYLYGKVTVHEHASIWINAAARGNATLLALVAGARPRCASVDIVRAPRTTGTSSYGSLARARKAARSLWELLAMRFAPLP